MGTLIEVAACYESESRSKGWRLDDAGRMAAALRDMVANRAGMDPSRHHISLAGMPQVTMRWLHSHGYQAAVTGADAAVGLIIQSGDHTLIANPPCTLTWNGQRIQLEEDTP